MGAISAIDIALWDIAGKYFGVPVYQLLGGKCRDKARVYYHVKSETKASLIEGIKMPRRKALPPLDTSRPFSTSTGKYLTSKHMWTKFGMRYGLSSFTGRRSART